MAETAAEATRNARAIVKLQAAHRQMIQDDGLGTNELRLLDLLFKQPLVNAALVARTIGDAPATAGRLIDRLGALDVLDEISGQQRNRVFRYTPYWLLFTESAIRTSTADPIQITESER